MTSANPFERFAAECGLSLTAEELYWAPRDVLLPPAESDRYFLVTIRRVATDAVLRLVYLTPFTDPDAPGVRDVLWWIAGDAWEVERAGIALAPWAADHGFASGDEATLRLFECHQRQATALRRLVGDAAYRRLLDIYDAEVSPSRPRLA